ncbi:hypothetical protein K4F52_003671 [Lecanicillium sp. MT-2017a]|nr:hypothetical protein K4F52_003671 [Lecanicillium sp. MT-2017a]
MDQVDSAPAANPGRKRKAESQDNERLSKRLSLLNIEQDGTKLYVPVESPSPSQSPNPDRDNGSNGTSNQDDAMHVDDTKHRVYIYNIDEELAEESSDDEGKLVFLPDIEKRLRENRIPPQVFANGDGELAGMQLVLYSDPKSLTVPEDKDGVRKAIIDSRRRLREQQQANGSEGQKSSSPAEDAQQSGDDDEVMDLD